MFKKYGVKLPTVIAMITLFIFTSANVAVAATEVISNSICNTVYTLPAGATCGQTFTTSESASISSIELLVGINYQLSKYSTLNVSIYNTDAAGLPIGNAVATSESQLIDEHKALLSQPNVWTTFNFSTPVNVAPATKYAFVINNTAFVGIGCVQSGVKINGVSYSDVYTNGEHLSFVDLNWSNESFSPVDLAFRINTVID